MARNWIRFEEPVPHEKDDIYVSMNYLGELVMNRHTFETLGRPEGAYMLYDPETDSIGVETTKRLEPNAFKIKPKAERANFMIRTRPFCKKHDIKYDGTVRFLDTKIEDGILVLNLLKTKTVTRGQNLRGRKRR